MQDHFNLLSDSRLFAIKTDKKRLAIFAAFSNDGIIPESTIYYLKQIRKVVDGILFITDNHLDKKEILKIASYIDYYYCSPHGEYDFGSWKIGIEEIWNANFQYKIDELILCNDSCFGPIQDLEPLFEKMEKKECDFWGFVNSFEIREHVQSWFQVFKKDIILNPLFINFFRNIVPQDSGWKVVLEYETVLTSYLQDLGYKYSCVVDVRDLDIALESNITKYPLSMSGYPANGNIHLSHKSPGLYFIKKKNFIETFHYNHESLIKYINFANHVNPVFTHIILEESKIAKNYNIGNIFFSLYLEIANYSDEVIETLKSINQQTIKNFQLLILYSGENADTIKDLQRDWHEQLSIGKFQIFTEKKELLKKHISSDDPEHWLCHIEVGDLLAEHFLESFAFAIATNPKDIYFYASEKNWNDIESDIMNSPTSAHIFHKSLYEINSHITSRILWHPSNFLSEYGKVINPVKIPQYLVKNNKQNISSRTAPVFHNSLISIIMLGEDKNFEVCQSLDSIGMQRGNFHAELIFAGISKNCINQIEKYENLKNCRIVFLSDFNLERAIKQACGDFIFFIKSGDLWLHPSRISRHLDYMHNNHEITISFMPGYKSNGKKIPSFIDNKKTKQRTIATLPYLLSYAHDCDFSGLCARRIFLQNMPSEIFLSQDPLLTLMIYARNFGNIGILSQYFIFFKKIGKCSAPYDKNYSDMKILMESARYVAPKDRYWFNQKIFSNFNKGKSNG